MKYVYRLNEYIIKLEEIVLASAILAMAATLSINAIGRTFFNQGIISSEEIGQHLIVVVTFIGLSYCIKNGRHISMLVIFDFLPPKFKKVVALIITGVTALAMGILSYISIDYIFLAQESGKVTTSLRIPTFYIIAIVAVGFILATLEYVLLFIKNISNKDVYLELDKPYVAEIGGQK